MVKTRYLVLLAAFFLYPASLLAALGTATVIGPNAPLQDITCTLAASNATPTVGATITLTAHCNKNPTTYVWTGCTSTASTCSTTAQSAGSVSYSVTASNASSSGSASISVNWQAAPPPVTCTLAASNTTPTVGSSITLTANCTNNPTSYGWTGCTSTTSTCSTTSQSTGSVTYSVTASNSTSSGVASANVTWQAAVPQGTPTSADFFQLASDPRGGDTGYGYFPVDANGRGIAFRNFSHNEYGNNSVWSYDPQPNAWTQIVPNTPWPGGTDVSGLSFLGNSDNGPMLVVNGELWALIGERGTSPTGNYEGILRLAAPYTWIVEDVWGAFRRVVGGFPHRHDDGAFGFVPSLSLVYLLGGSGPNATDTLELIDVSSTAPYPRTDYYNAWGNPPYPGAEMYRYISHNHWVRGSKVRVYGPHVDRNTGLTTGYNELAEIDLSVAPPVRRVVSLNTLPNAVMGEALICYAVPGTDLEVVTDGKRMNVHNAASDTWVSVPINQSADPNRESPSSAGSGRSGFYSTRVGQYILLGGQSTMYGIRLNFSNGP